MSDPFANFLGTRGTGTAEVRITSDNEQRRATVIAAYRNRIALPDLTIVNRKEAIGPIKVLDETGQELTPERWAELTKDRPKFTDCIDDKGDLIPGANLQELIKPVEAEVLGTSAVKNYHPIRVVTPIEFDEGAVIAEIEEINNIQDRINKVQDIANEYINRI